MVDTEERPALGQGHRPDPLHRLPRLHHRLQVGERGAAVGAPARTSSTSTSGVFPQARRAFQVTRCNQCDDAALRRRPARPRRCSGAPTASSTSTSRICIGCKACIAACPYDAIFINPEDHSAEKCNFCAHRLDVGLEPACVVVCPTEAILVGDLHDPTSRVAAASSHREAVAVRRPEKETRPKLFYKGAHQATLDPLAAARARRAGSSCGASRAAAPQPGRRPAIPDAPNSSAAALLAYDVPHRAPWDWRVSLYTWTKGIAAGAYLVARRCSSSPALLDGREPLWRWAAPLARRSRSWPSPACCSSRTSSTRALLPDLHAAAVAELAGARRASSSPAYAPCSRCTCSPACSAGRPPRRRWPGCRRLPLAVHDRGLHRLAVRAGQGARPLAEPAAAAAPPRAGGARRRRGAAAVAAPWLEPAPSRALALDLGGRGRRAPAAACAGEVTLTHPTAHARLAVREMTRGRYRAFFWRASCCWSPGVLGARGSASAAALPLPRRPARPRARVRPGRPGGAARLEDA